MKNLESLNSLRYDERPENIPPEIWEMLIDPEIMNPLVPTVTRNDLPVTISVEEQKLIKDFELCDFIEAYPHPPLVKIILCSGPLVGIEGNLPNHAGELVLMTFKWDNRPNVGFGRWVKNLEIVLLDYIAVKELPSEVYFQDVSCEVTVSSSTGICQECYDL